MIMDNNKTILVTDFARRIGKAIFVTLADAGWDIVVHGCNRHSETVRTAAEIEAVGGRCRILTFDVRNRQQCQVSLVADIEQYGAYYGVVLNTRVTRDNVFPALSDED